MTEFSITKNNNSVGVTIDNADIALGVSQLQMERIKELLHQYKLVVFKDQQLSDEQLKNFASYFGPPFEPDNNFPVLGSQESSNSIVVVGNQAHEYSNSYLGHQEVLPHSDHQWLKCPSSASLLYAIDIQEKSAPTVWYDMVEAYKRIDLETRAIIDHLKIVTYNPFYRPFGSVSAKYVDRSLDVPPGEVFPHPLVRIHPLTHEKILYMNIAYEIEFIGIPYENGMELFSKLQKHILCLDCKYEHHWSKSDLVLWDNRSTIHYRPSFDSSIRRVLKRLTIAGETPFNHTI